MNAHAASLQNDPAIFLLRRLKNRPVATPACFEPCPTETPASATAVHGDGSEIRAVRSGADIAGLSMTGIAEAEAVSGMSAGTVTDVPLRLGSWCGADVSVSTRGEASALAVARAFSGAAPDCARGFGLLGRPWSASPIGSR
jgi:hypothetical protein